MSRDTLFAPMVRVDARSLRNQLVAAFALLIALLVALGLFSIWELKKLGTLTTEIYEHPLVVSNAALAADAGVVRMHRSMKDVVLLDSPELIEDAVVVVESQEPLVRGNLGLVRERILGEEGARLAAETEELFDAWKPIREEVIALTRTGEREAAARITVGKGARHVEALTRKTTALAAYARDKARGFHATALRNQATAVGITVAMIITSFFLALLIATLATRRILRSEQEARRQHALLIGVLDGTDDAVFVKDRETRAILVNAACAEVFRRRPREIIGRTNAELVPAEVAAMLDASERRIMERGEPETVEERVPTADGPRTFITRKVPFRNDAGEVVGLIGVARDVTESKAIEEQLQHALRLDAIGTLAGGVAHEMNNVLAVVLGLGSMMLEDMPPDAPFRADVREIVAASRRGRSLVSNLLGFAQRAVIRRQRLSLNESVRRLIAVLDRTISKQVTIETKLAPQLAAIEADANQLTQILMNIFLNAVDALAGGGTISASTRNVVLAAGTEAERLGLAPGAYVELRVVDDGAGMSDETRERAFEPFFTTKPVGSGTGLGLSMVYGAVTARGGTVTLASKLGEGTTVTLLWPAAAQMDAAAEEAEAGARTWAEERGPEGRRILLVDDEEMIRATARRVLERAGHTVVVAGGGAEALEIYKQSGTTIDLVVLDLAMPDVDGEACFAGLRAIDSSVRVLICTGDPSDQRAARLRGAGVAGLVRKPLDVKELIGAVAASLAAPE